MMTLSVTDTKYTNTEYLILYYDMDKYKYRSEFTELPILKLAVI